MSSTHPGDPPFTPRREFIKDQSNPPSAFALLALSGANCIRLYSFAPTLISSLSRLFETHRILSFREDTDQSLCEFAIDGKPWANPKSVPSEKLLVDIMAVIYQCGYTYLSTIDYGREQDDRLVLTFARPAPSSSRTPTPVPHLSPPLFEHSSSSSLGHDKPKAKRVPFALSFSSVTVMRVISPPLHLTPAILQAVRGSWPRGVVSEKKVGDNSFEFKLKGYKWFQQDTFATDSLRHILALLTSLDIHSFTLLTSFSLTNRSRVKDLWIFTGPASDDSNMEGTFLEVPQSSVNASPAVGGFFDSGPPPMHQRIATDPTPIIPHSPTAQHSRAATETQRRIVPAQPHLLRKPAPRAQVPVSVVEDSNTPDEPPQIIRANLPSTISAGVENMTGIGASPNIVYASSPFGNGRGGPPLPSPRPRLASAGHERPPLRPVSDRVKTPPLLTSSSSVPPSPQKSSFPPAVTFPFAASSKDEENQTPPRLPPLLGLDTFRDSGMSGNSEASRDIPIKWSGPWRETLQAQKERLASRRNRVSSSGPQFPGGWQPTPVAEKAEDDLAQLTPAEDKTVTTPIHEMLSRIESPEIVRPEFRKSEAALVEIIQSTSPIPPMPQRQNSQRTQPPASGVSNSGKGWVLVNVENSSSSANAPAVATPPVDASAQLAHSTGAAPVPAPSMKSSSNSASSRPTALSLDPGPSPAAKAIVIIDAMESKHKKSRSTALSKENRAGGSGLKRFFSLNRKNSKKKINDDDDSEGPRTDSSNLATHSVQRSVVRDKIRLIGTPEASRGEDKRRSLD